MKKNKIITAMLAGVLAFSSLCGCGGSNADKIPDPVSPASDMEAHYVEGMIHDVNVNYDEPVGDLVKNGVTEYKIVAPAKFGTAAKFVSKHLNAATSATFGIVTSDAVDLSAGKYIVIGDYDEIKEATTVPSHDELGNQGYYIKTVGDDMLAYCTSENGAQLTALAVLRAIVGYDMLADDLVIYERDGSVMPATEIKEKPDYEFRFNGNTISDEQKYGMGYLSDGGMISTPIGNVHNLFDFLDPDANGEIHRKWFSSDPGMAQPCFTAHGDHDEYVALVDHMADYIIENILKKHPDAANMRISQNDVVGTQTIARCECAACNASFDYYGTMAGAMLSFANDIAGKVYDYIDDNEPGREFNIVILAYGATVKAPAKRKANGEYELDSEGRGIPLVRRDFDEDGRGEDVLDENGNGKTLICGRGVAYEYATSLANWIHSYYEPENRMYASYVEAWSGLKGDKDSLYVWSYEISYMQYLYPYNNYEILVENFRYFKQYGGNFIYPEGTWENPNNPGFAKFRDYVNGKAMFDVNVDYNSLVEKFFKYYFGEAGPLMRKYFDEVQLNLKDKEGITGGSVLSYTLGRADVWPEGLITSWNSLFDEAYKVIEKHSSDPELYDAVYKHILIESLFPRYVLCTTYALSFSKTQLKEMRKAFAEDFETLGNTTHEEHYTIDVIFSTWDLD